MDKVRLLVVDDSRVSHAMMEGILARSRFEICGYAKNCAEAIEKYRALSPDIVTMDMNLPDADGMECSRRIISLNSQAKIIMISAMRDASLMMQGRAVGIHSFLQKPLNANELIDTLQMVCQVKSKDSIKILRESYVNPFVKVLKKNLFSLAGLHSKIEIKLDEVDALEVNGIAIIIGITGNPMGRIILHTDVDTMAEFSRLMLGLSDDEDLTDEDMSESVEEAANIIAGRSVSMINDVFKDKELRVTPPGTICGNRIRIMNPKLISFNVIASTKIGKFKMNIGFAGGE